MTQTERRCLSVTLLMPLLAGCPGGDSAGGDSSGGGGDAGAWLAALPAAPAAPTTPQTAVFTVAGTRSEPGQVAAVTDGAIVQMSIPFPFAELLNAGKSIKYHVRFATQGKLLATNDAMSDYGSESFFMNVIPSKSILDPEKEWTPALLDGLARLGEGRHEVDAVVECEVAPSAERKLVGWGRFAFEHPGQSVYAEQAQEMMRKMGLSGSELAAARNAAGQGENVLKGTKYVYAYIDGPTCDVSLDKDFRATFYGSSSGGQFNDSGELWSGLVKHGKVGLSGYDAGAGNGFVIQRAPARGVWELKTSNASPVVAELADDGTISKGGKEYAKLYNVDLGDLPAIIRTLVPAYHHSDLFR